MATRTHTKKKSTQERSEAHRRFFEFTGGLQKEVRQFLSNLAVLTGAGMDIVSAVRAVEEESRSRRMRRYIGQIAEMLENGDSLADAMEYVRIFPKRVVALVHIGESSGRLVENLDTIVAQQEKEWLFKSKIRTAMLYPAIVLPLTFFVGIGVSWFALPRLADMYRQMNADLPTLTEWLIAIGEFLDAYGNIVIPIVLCSFVIVLYFLFSFPKTKAFGQILISRLPVFRKLIREVELARVGYILGNLLHSGIPITDAVASLRDATTFYSYRKFYAYMYEAIEEGNNFDYIFDTYKQSERLISHPIQQMIVTGERSGRLSVTLQKIGAAYETKVETSIKDISTLIEPVLLIIIGLAVALVALATLMPIYNLATII